MVEEDKSQEVGGADPLYKVGEVPALRGVGDAVQFGSSQKGVEGVVLLDN